MSSEGGPQGSIINLMHFSEKFSGHSFATASIGPAAFWLWKAWLQKVRLVMGMKSSTGGLPWSEGMICDWDGGTLWVGEVILWPLNTCLTFVPSLLRWAAVSGSLCQLRSPSWIPLPKLHSDKDEMQQGRNCGVLLVFLNFLGNRIHLLSPVHPGSNC